MIVFLVLLLTISLFFIFYLVRKDTKIKRYNIEIEEANKELELHHKLLLDDVAKVGKKLEIERAKFSTEVKEKTKTIEDLKLGVEAHYENQKKMSQRAFENYCEFLIQSYDNAEKDYNDNIDSLKKSLEAIKLENKEEIDKITAELDKTKATRAAVIQAQLREKEIKEKLSFYCLKVNDTDLQDIKALERVKGQLNKPRILSMLIWKTYWQKQMTELCNNVLGTNAVTGIYKITNQVTDECYIGQAANMADRWKQHAKCGLGIDTPAGNKLYRAMQEDGIQNFSWELLEECPRELLNEKEKFYIDLYDSQSFGYNTISAPIRKKED